MTGNNTTHREKGRAMFLAAVMVISVVAMSVAFTGSAAAQVTDATRTIEDTTLAPGESTSVTVDVQLDSQGSPDITEQFDPAFADVTISSANPLPDVQSTNNDNTELVAVWSDTDTAEITYNVTVPQNATDGETFSISGNASDADGSVAISGDSTITVQESQSNFRITSVNPEGANSSIDVGESQDYAVTVENTGSATANQTVTADVANAGSESTDLELEPGENATVNLSPSDVSALSSGNYDVTISTDDDSVTGTLSVSDPADRNLVDGEISDTQQNAIDNADEVRFTITYVGGSGDRADDLVLVDDVAVNNFSDSDNPDIAESVGEAGFVDNGEDIDRYFINLPNFGEGTQFEVSANLDGFDAFDGTTQDIAPGDSDTQNIRLGRQVQADELTVIDEGESTLPDDPVRRGSASADVEGSVDATAFVQSDDVNSPFDELDPLADEDVTWTVTSFDDPNGLLSAGDVNITPTTGTTDSDGTTDFTISLDLSGVDLDNLETDIDATVEFEAESGTATDTLNVTFLTELPSGDGTIAGNVEEIITDGDSNTQPADGVGVHAVNIDRVNSNTYGFTIDGEGGAFNADWASQTVASTSAPGEGSDYGSYYRVAELDDTGSVDQVLDVRTDYLVKSTGAAISQNLTMAGTGFTADSNQFVVAPLEPGDYQIQYSADGSFDSPVTGDFSVSENLTYEFTEQRYANSPAVHTDVTTDDGRYELYNLFTDGNTGKDYVVIAADDTAGLGFANMRGYDTVNVQQNANDGQLETDLTVFETDVIPDTITGENLGQISDADEADANYADDLDTDDPNEVERNGQMVDVIEINTTVDGNLIGTNATISIGPTSGTFDGEFLNESVGGDVVSHNGDSITVDTSPSTEGTAVVFLETDSDSEDVFVQIEAALENGLDEDLIGGEVDDSGDFNPGKRFIGVDTYDSGSIKGDIARDDDALTDTFVWTREIQDDAGNTITIDPDFGNTTGVSDFEDLSGDDDVRSLNFRVKFNDSATATVDEVFNATGAELRNVDLADRIGPIAAPNVSDFNLLRFANPLDADNPGQYSMDRVPAQDGGVDYTRIEARQYDTGERGFTDTVGSQSVIPGLTRNADITIPGALVEANYELSNLNPPNATVEQGADPITVSADVNNTGIDSGEQDVTLEVTNESGDVVYSDTQPAVVVDAGSTVTVEFTDVPAGTLDAGNYTHTISTDDDSVEGSLTIEESSGDEMTLEDYQQIGDGPDDQVSIEGLRAAIEDFTAEDIGIELLRDVIADFTG